MTRAATIRTIPTYNPDEALLQIARTLYRHFPLVVVNDGSDDKKQMGIPKTIASEITTGALKTGIEMLFKSHPETGFVRYRRIFQS